MSGITKGQIAKIWCLARELNMDRHNLYEYVCSLTDSDSISSLTKQQGMDVIDGLVSLTGAIPRRSGMATTEQIWLIQKLATQLGWDDNPKRLKAFIRKYAKVDELKWMTQKAASNIIEGLKGIKHKATEAP